MPSQGRIAAVQCLMRIEQGGFSNLVLKQELEKGRTDARDTAFCTALTLGTLSRQRTIDAVLGPYLRQPIETMDAPVRWALRTGVYQLRWMDSVPDRAAINESVELCRTFRKSSATGLVNAVLRKAAADRRTFDDPAVRYSVCPELLEQLRQDWPEDWERILEGFFAPSSTYVRVNVLKTTTDQVMALIRDSEGEASPTALPDCLRIDGPVGPVSWLIDRGFLHIQSLAAQSAALALAPAPGMKVLDMCAAPGGKTACLAQRMGNEGSVTALDIYPSRLKLIEGLCRRQGISIVRTVQADASAYEGEGLYDRILCDVPCSGYGETGAKPELRYKAPAASEELPALQRAILENAARLLKADGKIVYSTCTLLRRENEEIVASFLADHPEFRLCGEGMRNYIETEFREGFFVAELDRREP